MTKIGGALRWERKAKLVGIQDDPVIWSSVFGLLPVLTDRIEGSNPSPAIVGRIRKVGKELAMDEKKLRSLRTPDAIFTILVWHNPEESDHMECYADMGTVFELAKRMPSLKDTIPIITPTEDIHANAASIGMFAVGALLEAIENSTGIPGDVVVNYLYPVDGEPINLAEELFGQRKE